MRVTNYDPSKQFRGGLKLASVTTSCLAAWMLCSPALAQGDDPFQAKVEPIFQQRCLPCHSAQSRTSGLSVVDKKDLLAGGGRGVTVEPGNPDGSLLMKFLRGIGEPRMPLGGAPLPDSELETIANWIKSLKPADVAMPAGPPADWAFRRPKPVEPPAVKNAAWARNGIDRFILHKLEENGLHTAPEAPRPVLVRRVYFDLIGLPPTPAEVKAFVDDQSSDAYEKLVDKLLADPRYGERWGRH